MLPRIHTPLGVLMPLFVVDGEPAPVTTASAQVLDGSATLFSYQTPVARAELLVVPIEAATWNSAVRACIGAIWRFATWQDLETLSFECRWLAAPRVAHPIGLPGRELDAELWRGGGTSVVIGTENVDALRARARCGDGFPVRLREQVEASAVVYLDDGLLVRIPPLERHEQCQAQFVVSWAPLISPDAAWLAVHQTAAELLMAADVG